MKLLFIFILISVNVSLLSQRENTLPIKNTSFPTDTIRTVIDNQSSVMLRSVLQSDIYDSLAVHTDSLQALRADIDAGGSSQLMDSINQHRIEIDANLDSINVHRIEIDANLDSIGIHRTELDNAVDSLAAHRTDINSNTSTGTTNASNISANSVFIGVNTADIASLEDSIAKHTDTLQLHQTQIAALQAGGVSSDSSWTSIEVDTIDGLNTDAQIIFTDQESPFIQFWSDGNKVVEFQGAAAQFDVPVLYSDNAIIQTPISHSLTDGAPTDAQIDSATGTTPAAAGSGWKRLILDSDGSALMYIIISDGSNWQYTALTIAL